MEDQVDQSVEQTDTIPGVEESTSQVEASGTEVQGRTPEASQEDKLPPFHEHPRFKEVIEQNRGYKTELEQYKGALDRLQQQMETLKQQATPKPEKQKDQFITDLEKVNPAYAKYMETLQEQASKSSQLEQRIAQYEQQQLAEKALSRFDQLLTTNKVENPVIKEIYQAAVEAEIYRRETRGEKLGLKDMDTIFNTFHAKYAKFMEDSERAITSKYVTSKKADTAPKGATGGAATSPTAKKIAASDIQGQAKWMAEQIRALKKQV